MRFFLISALAAATSAYEWAGVFELEENTPMSFTAGKVDGKYADPAMKMYMVELGGEGIDYVAALEAEKEKAEMMMENGDCPATYPDKHWKGPGCTTLTFDQNLYASIFSFEMFHDESGHDGHGHGESEHAEEDKEEDSHDGHDHRRLDEDHEGHDHGGHDEYHPEHFLYFAMFLEHSPYEFEADVHYLKNAVGANIEPVYEVEGEHGHGGHDDDDSGGGGGGRNRGRAWRNSMIASVLVLLVTASGAVLRLFMCDFASTDTFSILAAAFAVGCLLATAFFLMFVEASHLIGARWGEESQMTWRFGSMALAGYMVGMISSMLGDHFHHYIESGKETGKPVTPDAEDQSQPHMEKAMTFSAQAEQKEIDHGLVFTIFMGDFLHNFVDGIFIANAFLDCSQSKGWSIAAATIAHEIAQETSDFFLLITQGGLSQIQALIINGLSGVSVIIGAAIYLWIDPGNGTRGLVLAFSGGTYVYIAATEAASVYTEKHMSLGMWGAVLLLFTIGAIAIGLVLLDHEHCSGDGGGGGDAHAGHNH